VVVKILVTGARGQLGFWLAKVFKDDELLLTDREEMDITNKEEVEKTVGNFKPKVIIHGAAFTNVDGAEKERDLAFLINKQGTENLVVAAEGIGAKLIYISTDYVFPGDKQEPYLEGDQAGPQSVYGESKLAGEEIAKMNPDNLIVRTAWLYGQNGKNFVETMLKLGREKEEISVVNDQIGSPTYTKDLAEAIKFLIENEARGIYHATNEGDCSWFDFAKKIFAMKNLSVKVLPTSTEELNRPAKRPKHSVLSKEKLASLGFKIRDWDEALADYLANREEK
jgi:dTDP-4-dehydrorhamnose reductase